MTGHAAPLFIAEVSSNHNGDLNRCMAFVDTAAAIGCDGVKFQLFRIEELFAPEILERSPDHRKRKDWELPAAFLPAIAQRCKEKDLLFGCSPFFLDAVHILAPLVDFLKLSSYELLWHGLHAACAATGRPLVLSTGMATLDEIAAAVAVLRQHHSPNISLLHCVSSYPAAPAACNLAFIETLRQRFGLPVGWSDHSSNEGVVSRAVHRFQAAIVEFHLDLDGHGAEAAMGHCWLPESAARMIAHVRAGIDADGSSAKVLSARELAERPWRADPTDGIRPLRTTRPGAFVS